MPQILTQIDRFLFPHQEKNHLTAYVWLIYLGIFFISLYYYRPIENSVLYATFGTLLFFVAYFNGYNTTASKIKWNILAILIIATLMTILTPGASVFFVYAAAFCSRLGDVKKAFIGLIFISFWIIAIALLFGFSYYFYIPALLYSLIIGGANIYQYKIEQKNAELLLTQKEVKYLAKTSERERIARDLHDLIGHTFSVITLKAELAGKLMDKDREKAKDEIKQLENISRDALKQIREVVTGYRSSDLATELAHTKYVLENNSIQFHYDFKNIEISESINKELAIILKELVTNILKHAQANRVTALIKIQNNSIVLQVEDDGIGFTKKSHKGYGLIGIQERVANLSGEFNIDSSTNDLSKTTFTIKIPLP